MSAKERVKRFNLPKFAQPPVRYGMCIVKRDGVDTAAANTFMRKVLGPAGRKHLRAYGFGVPKLTGSAAVGRQGAGFAVFLTACLLVALAFLLIPILAIFLESPVRDLPDLLTSRWSATRSSSPSRRTSSRTC